MILKSANETIVLIDVEVCPEAKLLSCGFIYSERISEPKVTLTAEDGSTYDLITPPDFKTINMFSICINRSLRYV